ncbi:histidine kinase [Bacillus sp. M6-12]|uniref:sensor histidine kinase n=1 Tax=Bacillus sp. M6-12 TaxID=2054166 RepID=UPI000C7876A3|nr:sensor histidine kinase [Bacillus sp. M6-12]PLS17299.1 histidine kinase [Bacillus sp. M6-12]
MIETTSSIDSLCKLHTNLTEIDIEKIKIIAENLPLIADLNQANMFIDCLTKEGKHAIVVAEASPTTAKSVYQKQVAGKFAYEAFEPAVFFTLKTAKPILQNRALTQEGKTVEQSVVPVIGAGNRIIGALIMEKDISEKLQHQFKIEALSEATETLSEILIGMTEDRPIIPEVMQESLFFINSEKLILYFNPAAINLIFELCSAECRVGASIYEYFSSLDDIIDHQDELLMREISLDNKVFQLKKIRLDQNGKSNGMFLIFRDITELRQKERELIVKSVAIREIHHRVKNNLQTVASLLRLQMRRGVPDESKVHFIESLNRVLSIAAVYELILSNSSVDDVEIRSLTEKIGNMLVYSEDHENTEITIEYSGPRLEIKSNVAVSLALVINELIQNCIKHAFRSVLKGRIDVSFVHNDSHIEVLVKDDGDGYLPDAKPSLGLDIVKMMIEHDLSGEFTIQRAEIGTIASVRFPHGKGALH